jgi:hypothetical protein
VHLAFSPLLQDLAWLGCTQVLLDVPCVHLQLWMHHVEGSQLLPFRPGTAVVLLQVCAVGHDAIAQRFRLANGRPTSTHRHACACAHKYKI